MEQELSKNKNNHGKADILQYVIKSKQGGSKG